MILPKLLLLLVPLLMMAQNNVQRDSNLPGFRLMRTLSPVLNNPTSDEKFVEVITQQNIPSLYMTDIKVTYKNSKIVNIFIGKAQEVEAKEPVSTIIIDTKNDAKKSIPATKLGDFVSRSQQRSLRPRSIYRPNLSKFSSTFTTVIQNTLKTPLDTSKARKILDPDTFQSTVNLQNVIKSDPTSKSDKIVNVSKALLTTNSSANYLFLKQNEETTKISDLILSEKPRSESALHTTKFMPNEAIIESIIKEDRKRRMTNEGSSFHLNLNKKTTPPIIQPVDINNRAQPTIKCPHRYGFFPAPYRDCGHFIICQEGIATTISCPAGLAFNVKIGTCDWPINVPGCNLNVFQDFTCPTTKLNNSKAGNQIYNYKYNNSCKKYIACHEGRPRLLSCDAGLFFDEKTETCVDANLIINCGN